MTRTEACLLCGGISDVSVSLVEWREPIDGRRFEALPRCRDRSACRERCELLGDPWLVVDPGPAPLIQPPTPIHRTEVATS